MVLGIAIPVAIALMGTTVVLWLNNSGVTLSGGDPGGRLMARLAPVTKVIPGFDKGHVPWIAFPCDSCGFPATYAVKIEPRVDSCDGVAGTFGWDPAVIQVGFLWAGTTQALVDLLGQRLDARGWTRGNAPAWAEDGVGDVWNYPPGHAPVETLTLDPHSHGPWMVTIEAKPKGKSVSCYN